VKEGEMGEVGGKWEGKREALSRKQWQWQWQWEQCQATAFGFFSWVN